MRLAPLVAWSLLAVTACSPGRVHPRAAEEVRRGYAHLESGDLERAGVAFEHALAFNAAIPEALNGAAIVARRSGRNREARELLARAIVTREEFAEAHVNLGELDLAEGRGADAESRFRHALSIDPDLLPARLDLSRALLHRGRAAADASAREALWAAARREYLHLLESHPDLADAWLDLAWMDHESGRFERAADEYARAARADPAEPEARLGACVSLARAGKPSDARAACLACVAIAPQDGRCAASLRALDGAARR